MTDQKVEKINSLRSQIEQIIPSREWDDVFLEKVKVDFTYNSNKLEGNTVTHGQTVKLLIDFVTPQNAAPGELLDLINHQHLLDKVFSGYRSQQITEENIKELHKELMKNVAQWNDDGLYSPGRYKSFENVTIRSNGKIHTYLPPAEVQPAMTKLVDATNQQLLNINIETIENHPLTIATQFHQEFLNKIHPFSDGNGRIGRIIANLILLKAGFPPIFIKDVDRKEYLKRFEISDETILPMLDFLADRLIESLETKLKFVFQIR